MTDPFVGKLTYFRVYSGMLQGGLARLQLHDTGQQGARRAHAPDAREPARGARRVGAGEIAAAVGLKQHDHGRHAVRPRRTRSCSSRSTFPEPVIDVADRAEDEGRPGQARHGARSGSPRRTRRSASRTDEETGQTIISGMGELHLEIIVDRLDARVQRGRERRQAAGRVPRDDRRKPSRRSQGKFVRQTGGRGQYGHVVINARAERARRGLRVRGQDRRRRDPEGVHPGRRRGHPGGDGDRRARRLSRSWTSRSTLIDGSYHEVDSSRDGIQDRRLDGVQGGHAKGRARRCSSRSWRWRSMTPEEYMGDVIGDLTSRRGQIRDMEPRGNAQVITAPRAAVRRCSATRPTVRSLTPGPGDLHHAVRKLRGSPEGARRRDRRGSLDHHHESRPVRASK